jgi:hypothetical protein
LFSPPIEVADSRAEMPAVVGGTWYSQTVLRLRYGHAAPFTPRRPVHAVTRFAFDYSQEEHHDR